MVGSRASGSKGGPMFASGGRPGASPAVIHRAPFGLAKRPTAPVVAPHKKDRGRYRRTTRP